MIVLCSWCIRDNRPAFLREIPPYRDPSVSHGICAAHQQEQLKATAAALRGRQEERSS